MTPKCLFWTNSRSKSCSFSILLAKLIWAKLFQFFPKTSVGEGGVDIKSQCVKGLWLWNAFPEDIEKSQNTKKFKFGQNMVLCKKFMCLLILWQMKFLLRSMKLLMLVYLRECLLCFKVAINYIQFNTVQDDCGTHVFKVITPIG